MLQCDRASERHQYRCQNNEIVIKKYFALIKAILNNNLSLICMDLGVCACVCARARERPPCLLGAKAKTEGDKDRATRAPFVVMKDHFILAALTMVIFHH